MTKFLYYVCGVGLILFGLIMASWFYFGDFSYSITHITNPQYFARIVAPLVSIYLGLFYLYGVIKNKADLSTKISLYVLVIGLFVSVVIMSSTPLNFGGPIPYYALILDSIWRTLMPSSVIISVLFSFVSLFKKKSSNLIK